MAEKIGILNGGGDCSGLNAVIASIVKAGIPMGYEFIGFERGWEGVLDPMEYRVLDRAAVRGISHLGGTILRTSNKGRFAAKVGSGDKALINPDILDMAERNLKLLGVSGLIVIGGDGTLSGALQMAERGIKLVGVPKTIDNDLSSTDQTFGFSTAVQVAVDALDKIHTTAASHDRTIIVECMGRNAGWITLFAGLAGNANAILLPEFEFKIEDLVAHLRSRSKDHRSSIIAVAEGARIGGKVVAKDQGAASEVLFGGISSSLARAVEEIAPGEFEMRTVVLGHTQRGGSPNPEDRILSKRYGVAAIEAYRDGKFNHMVSLRDGQIITSPIAEAVDDTRNVTEETPAYKTAKSLGIFIH
jgi:ATP-dependent phosphofructokinase / diphosphate-dependent phosphofructokinase